MAMEGSYNHRANGVRANERAIAYLLCRCGVTSNTHLSVPCVTGEHMGKANAVWEAASAWIDTHFNGSMLAFARIAASAMKARRCRSRVTNCNRWDETREQRQTTDGTVRHLAWSG